FRTTRGRPSDKRSDMASMNDSTSASIASAINRCAPSRINCVTRSTASGFLMFNTLSFFMVYLLFIDCLDTIRIHHLIFSNLPSHTQNSIIAQEFPHLNEKSNYRIWYV